MSSTLLIIWLIVAVISIAYFVVSNIGNDFDDDEEEQEKYPAVTIVVSETDACASVIKLNGKRLLSTEAPLLPLVDCTAEECTCTYRHYVDRRGGSRRFDEKSVVKKLYGGSEKRVRQRGRRAEDIMEDTFEQTQDEVIDTHSDTYFDYIDRTGLFKAMAAKEAEDAAADSSAADSSASDSSASDSSASDSPGQASVATLTPASPDEAFATDSSGQKKSGRSRS